MLFSFIQMCHRLWTSAISVLSEKHWILAFQRSIKCERFKTFKHDYTKTLNYVHITGAGETGIHDIIWSIYKCLLGECPVQMLR